MVIQPITVLAGGTGAAKFLQGLVRVVPAEQVSVIVNVGDDEEFWGLHLSPDIDSVLYGLAGQIDEARGWGRRDESFNCMRTMHAFGEVSWFQIGDRDLAAHLIRTRMLREGHTLEQVTARLAAALGVRSLVVPATNDRLRTIVNTVQGPMRFQEFFVRERWRPLVTGITYEGGTTARATAAAVRLIRGAPLVIVAPSNPITSIGPMLAVQEIHDALRCTRGRVVAISPIVGTSAVSGPAGRLMEACGYEVSVEGVCRFYQDVADAIVIHPGDSARASALRAHDVDVQATEILMPDAEAAAHLAQFVVDENCTVAG